MRVVLDSNVLMAAFATQGLCHTLLELTLTRCSLMISEPLLTEVSQKLVRKIKLSPSATNEVVLFLRKSAELFSPRSVPATICSDPKDRHILGLALSAGADLLVSGDNDLLVLKTIEQIPIITPRDFYLRLKTLT